MLSSVVSELQKIFNSKVTCHYLALTPLSSLSTSPSPTFPLKTIFTHKNWLEQKN